MNRRDFLGQTAIGLAALSVGTACAAKGKKGIAKTQPQTFAAQLGDIRALFLQLGNNMWCDYPAESMGRTAREGIQYLAKKPDLKLVCRDEVWRAATDRMAELGLNMVVVDLGEGLFYPSHPELAIEGTWSIEKMRAEIKRLNQMGIEVVPKLNFSTTHNGWMGDYTHMVSSKPYYRMCEEVISDVIEIFGHPRFFHIGYDEESASFQERHGYQYICARKDEFWWKDFLHIIGTLEKHNARPWMWSDYGWHHEDFYDRCPKSVVQQNWFYDSQNGGFDMNTNKTSDLVRLQHFVKLDKAGFDQVPCGTNWVGGVRKKLNMNADDVMGKLVTFIREHVSQERLMGFMLAPWCPTDTPENGKKILDGISQLAEAVKQ
ncbi:MAG: hypothetical protein ILA34_05405 [Bacteroidaceae bacterium]|nr:hypothetical protein [Bacteroidaceae bacterium]